MVRQRTGNRGPEGETSCFGVLYCIVIGAFLTGCGSTAEIQSSWNGDQITIDGNSSEWGSGLTNLKDTKVFLGVRNDGDNLYLCLTSPEQQFRRQLMGLGLSIWFESEGGKRMGVLYPIGFINQVGQPSFNQDGTRDPEDRDRMAEQALVDLEILGPGEKDRNLFSVVQSPGIGVKIGGPQGGAVVYELKVPLKKSADHPYAIDAVPGSNLKIEIITGKSDAESRRSGGGEGMGAGGGGGRRGRGGGGGMGGGGMRGGGERPGGQPPKGGSRPEPLDVSVKVHLAGSTSDPGH